MNFAEELCLYEKVNKAASYFQVEVYNYKDNVWETSRGPRVLKTWERGDFTETRKMAIELAKSSLVKVCLPYKGEDEGYLFENLYYLVDESQNRSVDLTNLMDLERVTKFLANLHKLALYERQGEVLSVHIMPESFFVDRYGILMLAGFENLRVENPLLSLAHLLYDCKNANLKEFVLAKYEQINPLDRNALRNTEKLIWDSAIILGQQGPKKIDTQLGIDKLQELVGMLWPLINMQEYTNIPVSEYLDTAEINPVYDVVMSDMNQITTTEYQDEELALKYEQDTAFKSNVTNKDDGKTLEPLVEENTEEITIKDEERQFAHDNRAEKTVDGKKAELISWKPFPKLPNRRW